MVAWLFFCVWEGGITMKKALFLSTVITAVIALILVYAHAEIDQRDFDGDGDIDGYDLSVFAEKFGAVIWYKDFDGDLYSDGNTVYAVSQPTDYYLESQLTAINGDCDDGDENVNPGAYDECADGIDNDCNGFVDDTYIPIIEEEPNNNSSTAQNLGSPNADWCTYSIEGVLVPGETDWYKLNLVETPMDFGFLYH